MNWLREPLVHFVLLGAALFAASRIVPPPEESRANRIAISPSDVERLAANWSRQWMRPPTADDLRGLIEDEIKDEVYSREARAMGLDRGDVIVRRRLRQKLEFLTADVAEQATPTDAELEAFFASHAHDYDVEPRLAFVQIPFTSADRGAALRAAAEILARLSAAPDANVDELGDPTILPRDVTATPLGQIADQFGKTFAERLIEAPAGAWSGPIESAYGLHIVRVRERIAARTPALADVRSAVVRDWVTERRRRLNDEHYARLRAKYDVSVEWPESVGARADAPTSAAKQ